MGYKNIEIQEDVLQFNRFSNEDAIAIGLLIYNRAKSEGLKVAIDISRNGTTLFHVCLEGSGPDNERWMKRKRNTVYYFERSSLIYESPLRERIIDCGLSFSEYAPSGGGFPVRIKDTGVVGAVIVSGLASIDDHNLVAWAIGEHLGIENCPQAEIVD